MLIDALRGACSGLNATTPAARGLRRALLGDALGIPSPGSFGITVIAGGRTITALLRAGRQIKAGGFYLRSLQSLRSAGRRRRRERDRASGASTAPSPCSPLCSVRAGCASAFMTSSPSSSPSSLRDCLPADFFAGGVSAPSELSALSALSALPGLPASEALRREARAGGASGSDTPPSRMAAMSSLLRMREMPLSPMVPASAWSSARRIVESEGWALEVSVTSVLTVWLRSTKGNVQLGDSPRNIHGAGHALPVSDEAEASCPGLMRSTVRCNPHGRRGEHSST